MEESKNKKSRNKPVYRKILTIKDINVKNLDTSEKNGANEQTLKHPSSAAANNISKDTNTNEIRNHEGEITQEPRINLTTILRGIRCLYNIRNISISIIFYFSSVSKKRKNPILQLS